LVLETRNSPIAVNVTLTNDLGEKKPDDEGDELADFSKLLIKTSNSPLYSNISLVAVPESLTDGSVLDGSSRWGLDGGKFAVDTFTSSSPLHVNFAHAPVDSILRFIGFTTNAPAVTFLHPTFQGDFLVKSTLFGPKIDINQDVQDPKGEGRTRTVGVSKVGKQIVGKVYWGSEEESKDAFGHVKFGSTLLPATLKL
jgi:hypothetical protein